MPELPEVETVKRTLELKLIGKVITNVDVYHDNIIEFPSISVFKKNIVGMKINGLDRYGKWLILDLGDYYLFSHLRMEGKYFFRTSVDELNKHEHIVFHLDDGTELRYMDVRKFGKMHLIPKSEMELRSPLLGMGLEPWDDNLTIEYLKNKYSRKKLPIKSVLLDQSVIVGIGNIYADEILFLSNINPLTVSCELTDRQLESIITNTKKVLELAIEKGGSTIRSYTSVDGVHGLFQQELYVHSKVNEPCRICSSNIIKIKVGGRGTYYCPECQK